MTPSSVFPTDYGVARARFREASQRIGWETGSVSQCICPALPGWRQAVVQQSFGIVERSTRALVSGPPVNDLKELGSSGTG